MTRDHIASKLAEVMNWNLRSGAHEPEQIEAGHACLLEATAYVAGEPLSDHPDCVCPVLAAFGGGRSEGHSGGRSVGRSEGHSGGRSVGRSEGRSGGRSEGRSVGRSEGRSEGRSGGRSEGRSGGRSEGRSVGRSGAQADRRRTAGQRPRAHRPND